MAANQQQVGGAALEANQAGLHAALGRQKCGQAGLLQAEQDKILRQLAVQKLGCVVALHADDAQMGEGGDAVKEESHG